MSDVDSNATALLVDTDKRHSKRLDDLRRIEAGLN